MTRDLEPLTLIILTLLLATFAAGCLAQTPAKQPAQGDPSHTEKTKAPGTTTLTVDKAAGGLVTATLEFTATDDVQRLVARLEVPPGVTLTSGKAETDLGKIAAGQTRALTYTLSVPPKGAWTLAGGFDCHITDGVKLHAGRTLALGGAPPKPAPKTDVISDPAGNDAFRTDH